MIVVTTYISEDPLGIREYEYRAVLSFLKNNVEANQVIVLEAKDIKGSFLEEYGFQVVYANIPNTYKNKGCNEIHMLRLLKNTIKDDVIIKLTGRYLFKNNKFFDTVHKSIDDEVVCRLSGGKLWMGCFSVKRDIFFSAIDSLNLEKMEKEYICAEDTLWDILCKCKVKILKEIGILARIGTNTYISQM
jgi:hypothetical protein